MLVYREEFFRPKAEASAPSTWETFWQVMGRLNGRRRDLGRSATDRGFCSFRRTFFLEKRNGENANKNVRKQTKPLGKSWHVFKPKVWSIDSCNCNFTWQFGCCQRFCFTEKWAGEAMKQTYKWDGTYSKRLRTWFTNYWLTALNVMKFIILIIIIINKSWSFAPCSNPNHLSNQLWKYPDYEFYYHLRL